MSLHIKEVTKMVSLPIREVNWFCGNVIVSVVCGMLQICVSCGFSSSVYSGTCYRLNDYY
jgi:hypothetical protein